eukprot:1515322-Pleurochrysis_carterae.AAC.1
MRFGYVWIFRFPSTSFSRPLELRSRRALGCVEECHKEGQRSMGFGIARDTPAVPHEVGWRAASAQRATQRLHGLPSITHSTQAGLRAKKDPLPTTHTKTIEKEVRANPAVTAYYAGAELSQA